MSDQKSAVILIGAVSLILVVLLAFSFSQDDGDPVVGGLFGALVAVVLCTIAWTRPRMQDAKRTSPGGEQSAAQEVFRRRRDPAAWRFVAVLVTIVVLWLIVFLVL